LGAIYNIYDCGCSTDVNHQMGLGSQFNINWAYCPIINNNDKKLEGLYLPAGLGTPRDPQNELEGVAGEREVGSARPRDPTPRPDPGFSGWGWTDDKTLQFWYSGRGEASPALGEYFVLDAWTQPSVSSSHTWLCRRVNEGLWRLVCNDMRPLMWCGNA